MPYSDEFLYVPRTAEEIDQIIFEAYKTNFNINISFEAWKGSNIRTVIELLIQSLLQQDLAAGLLYDKIVSYLKEKQQDLVIVPRGSTPLGMDNAFQALVDAGNITDFQLSDPNSFDGVFANGEMGIAVEYTRNNTDDYAIAKTIFDNKAIGIKTYEAPTGNISYDIASPRGKIYTMSWVQFTPKPLLVEIKYQYDPQFEGVRLDPEEIKNIYKDIYDSAYEAGRSIFPAKINCIENYPSLGGLRTRFATTLPFAGDYDQVLVSGYSEKYTLDVADITATEVS